MSHNCSGRFRAERLRMKGWGVKFWALSEQFSDWLTPGNRLFMLTKLTWSERSASFCSQCCFANDTGWWNQAIRDPRAMIWSKSSPWGITRWRNLWEEWLEPLRNPILNRMLLVGNGGTDVPLLCHRPSRGNEKTRSHKEPTLRLVTDEGRSTCGTNLNLRCWYKPSS